MVMLTKLVIVFGSNSTIREFYFSTALPFSSGI